MLKIELDKHEYNYLCHTFSISSKYKNVISSCNKDNDKYFLKISEDLANEIRDLCGEQLQLIGFDEKYDPTPEGKILESLIDKLFIG